MKSLCKFHLIPGTQSHVITKVHDLLKLFGIILLGVKNSLFGLQCRTHFFTSEEHKRYKRTCQKVKTEALRRFSAIVF